MEEVSDDYTVPPAQQRSHMFIITGDKHRLLCPRAVMTKGSLLVGKLVADSIEAVCDTRNGNAGVGGHIPNINNDNNKDESPIISDLSNKIPELPLPPNISKKTFTEVYKYISHYSEVHEGTSALHKQRDRHVHYHAAGTSPCYPEEKQHSLMSIPDPADGWRAGLSRPMRDDLSALVSEWDMRYVTDVLMEGRVAVPLGEMVDRGYASVTVAGSPKKGPDTLFNVLFASDFLQIPSLIELCGAAITDAIKHMNEDEIMMFFDVEGPFTKADEEVVAMAYPWLKEGLANS